MSVYYYSIRLINKASGFSTAAKQRCHADQLVLDEKTIKEMWKTCSLPSDVFTFFPFTLFMVAYDAFTYNKIFATTPLPIDHGSLRERYDLKVIVLKHTPFVTQ